MVADVTASLRGAIDNHPPVLIYLAGPNGAGKSTFFSAYLENLHLLFVNADLMKKQLLGDKARDSSEADLAAFRMAEKFRRTLLDARASFCTETVFSDTQGAKLGFLREARAVGYSVFLIFIGLESKELSMARVQQRVEAGGHDVPDEKLEARFDRTLNNLREAVLIASESYLYDNSSARKPFRPIAVYHDGRLINRYPPLPKWAPGLPGL